MLNNQHGCKPTNHLASFSTQLHDWEIKTRLIIKKSRRFSADGFLLTLIKSILDGKASFNQIASRPTSASPKSTSNHTTTSRPYPTSNAPPRSHHTTPAIAKPSNSVLKH